MAWLGDIHLGDTIDVKFATVQATGAPTTLAGSPVISAYVGNGTTEITAGITLTVDFDSRTGLNNVRVVASGGNGFAAATNVDLVITTGTVNSVSAVGYVVGSFSIDCRGVNQILGTAVSTPATAGILDVNVKNMNNVAGTSITTVSANQGTTQPLNFTGTAGSALVKGDVVDIAGAAVSTSTAQIGANVVNFGGSAGTFASGRPEVNTTHIAGTISPAVAGKVGVDFAQVSLYAAGAFPPTAIVDSGTAQSATGTTLVMRSAAAFSDSELVGATVVIRTATTGAGQSRLITANVGSTDTLTVDTWTTTPTGTITYDIFGSPPSSATSPGKTDVVKWNGTAVSSPATAGIPEVNIKNMNNVSASAITTIKAVQGLTTADTISALAANTITATSINAAAFSAAKFAADSGLVPIRSSTATAGAATTITLDGSASATNSFYNNCLILLTGGTGVGQARFITAYVGATKVATVATWVTNPDNTTTFAILPFDAVAGATAPTVAQIATAVWQDSTAGDFTAASSIGKSLYTSGVVPGGTNGLFIAGTNAATTITTALTTTFTGNLTGSVASVTAGVTVTTNNDKTGYTLSTAGMNSVSDNLLDRDMSTGTDSGSPTVRTTRQALRALRNKVDTTTLTVYKEDDTTASWTFALTTDAAALPITVINPAG